MNPDWKEIHMDLATVIANLSSNVSGILTAVTGGLGDLIRAFVGLF